MLIEAFKNTDEVTSKMLGRRGENMNSTALYNTAHFARMFLYYNYICIKPMRKSARPDIATGIPQVNSKASITVVSRSKPTGMVY